MKKTNRKIFFIGGGIVLFIVLLFFAAVLFFYLNKPLVKNILQDLVAKKSGMTLAVEKLGYKLFPLRVDGVLPYVDDPGQRVHGVDGAHARNSEDRHSNVRHVPVFSDGRGGIPQHKRRHAHERRGDQEHRR